MICPKCYEKQRDCTCERAAKLAEVADLTTILTWIPVGEKLPDDGFTVLIAEDDGDVSEGFLDGDDWRYISAERVYCPVTHWAEMPAAPKA